MGVVRLVTPVLRSSLGPHGPGDDLLGEGMATPRPRVENQSGPPLLESKQGDPYRLTMEERDFLRMHWRLMRDAAFKSQEAFRVLNTRIAFMTEYVQQAEWDPVRGREYMDNDTEANAAWTSWRKWSDECNRLSGVIQAELAVRTLFGRNT